MKRSISTAIALAASLSTTAFAGGPYDGVYQYGLSPVYYSVHQNGSQMLVASMGFTSISPDIVFRFGAYEVSPTSIGTWDYSTGIINENKARISGVGLFGSCVTTTDITFDEWGGVSASLISYTNTAFGTSQGVDCAALFRQAVATLGNTITLRKIF